MIDGGGDQITSALSLLFVVVSMLIGEIVVRRATARKKDPRATSSAFLDQQVAERVLTDASNCKYVSHPYVMFRLKPGQLTSSYQINRLGFRGGDIGPKLVGRKRIVLVGNSVLWGTGALSDMGTVPGQLQRFLEERDGVGSWEVINAGMRAYTTAQEFILLHQEILQLAPDLIVSFDGITDIDTALENGCVGYSPRFFEWKEQRQHSFKNSMIHLVKQSLLLTQAVRALRRRPKHAKEPAHPEPDQVADYFYHNVLGMAQLARANGVQFIATLHPTLSVKKCLSAEEQQVLVQREGRIPAYGEYVRQCYDAFRNRLDRLRTVEGATVLDLSVCLDGITDSVFFDWTHMNERANGLVAMRLADAIHK